MREPRVAMPSSRHHAFVEGDVAAQMTADSTRYARRFSMDVAEDALAKMGPVAIQYITERLAETVVQRHAGEIESVVYSYINDRAWAEPIIREAIGRTVAQFVRELFAKEGP